MKDNRFIELVNLYIDRQISAAEAADLEAEMQAHPRRRAIYRQYCQMHRATTLVYESFRADAPEATGDANGKATRDRLAVQLPPRRSHWAYYAGGLAAACLALVFVRMSSNPAAGPDLSVAAVQVSQARTAAVAPAAMRPAPTEKRTTLVSLDAATFTTEQDYVAMLATMRRQDRQAFANGQIQSNRLPSLFEDGVFETQQGFPANAPRVFRRKATAAQQAEFTAFQFQR